MKPLEKLNSLTKYRDELKNRLSGSVPEKHKNHPDSYKSYLNLEIRKVTVTIDKLKMSITEGK